MWNLSNYWSENSLVWSLGAAVSLAALVGLHQYEKNKFSYWSRRGIKGPPPWPLMGNIVTLFGSQRRQVGAQWRKQFGKVYGVYEGGKPSLMVGDPEVVRQICIKDFDVFPNHDTNFFVSDLQQNFIFFAHDNRWRHLRARLSPTFSSGKMRRMYKLMERCADDLLESFGEQFERASQGEAPVVNLKDLFNLYTMDAIASCCYGLKLERQKSVSDLKTAANRNEFVRLALKMFQFRIWRLALSFALSRRLQELLDFKLSPESDLWPFANRVQQLIDRRKGDSSRKFDDYLQIILDSGRPSSPGANEPDELDSAEQHHAGAAEMESSEQAPQSQNNLKLDDMAILSNATMLLAVGLDTTSNLLTHCSYALAHFKSAQDRLHQEVKQISVPRESGGFDFEYNSLTSCHYLDSVLSETLRLLSPALQTDRIATRDYYIEKYKITLPKGAKVTINLLDIMLDEEFWPEPWKFEPERFMPENRHKIVPGSYLPFGMGPRHCLGMRFALTEAKLALAKLIMEFEFSPAPGKNFPPEFKLNNIREPLVRLERRVAS